MVETTQNQLVVDIAHDLIAQTVPQELELFSITSEAYFKNPDLVRKNQEGRDERLGFGAAEIAALSPIIIAVVDNVIEFVLENLIQGIKDSGIMDKVFKKGHSRHNRKVALPLQLTTEQMRQVHEMAIKSALQFKLSQAQAEQLATSLVGRLALANG